MASMSPPLNFIAAIPIKKGVAAIVSQGKLAPALRFSVRCSFSIVGLRPDAGSIVTTALPLRHFDRPRNLAIALEPLRCNSSICCSNSGVIFPPNPKTPLFVGYWESVPGGQVFPSFGGTSLLKWYQSSIWTASITSLALAGLF